MAGNVVGEGADDVSVERGAIGVRKLLSAGASSSMYTIATRDATATGVLLVWLRHNN